MTAAAAPTPDRVAPPARGPASPAPLPARIGAYPVSAVIGTGSMGVVYLGHDPVIDRPVAIKTLRRHLLDDGTQHEGVAQRFRIEARAAGRLNHRGIVSVYQFAEDEDFAYIVMEYVRGHSLAQYLKRPDRLPRQDVLCLLVQLLEALHYAHEAGVVHRDIKPANLMVDTDGWLKITDFGIARTESSSGTKTNALVGTPGYMAPELYVGGAFDRRVDIFSAGVLMYQLLTGHKPFSGTMESIMYEIVYKQHVPLAQRSGDHTLDLFEPVLDRALAKDPGQRFASAQEFIRALRSLAAAPLPAHLAPQGLLPFQPPWEGENALATLAPRATPARLAAAMTAPEADDAAAAAAALSVAPGPATPTPAPPPDAGPAWADTASGEDEAGPATGTGDSHPPTATEPVPTGWDPSALAGLEQELARLVGPMAKVLVRRAARGQVHLDGVRQAAAAALVDATVRQRFLAGAGGAAATAPAPLATTPGTLPPTGTLGSGGQARMSAQDAETATAVLRQAIGPIASVLVRRCTDLSGTREQFISRVMAQLVDRVDSAALQAELTRRLG